MTMTPALGALAQASDALSRVAADPQSGAEAAVATTIDFTLLILGPIIGAFVGVVVSVVFAVLARKALAKSATASSILARVRRSLHFTLATWGAWVGLGIALVNPHLSDWNGSSVTTFLMHILLIAGLACLTWMGYAAAWVFEDAAKARQSADKGRSRRFETQAQVLRRLTQGIVVVVGTIAIIGTFEAARQAMTTVLASAGVLSVIAGLAAQQTLGNVFAGLQLAFTDAIRVGDVVVAGDKQETGSVEEITLSYVVVRIWDERRLIIPCRYFTQTPFENWTRRAAAQLGTVELKLDWSAPMTLIRTKVEQLLTATDLWDGRTWAVQITDSDEYTVTVRILVSATNSGNLNDLRAYLREQVISWIVSDEPWARPAQRIEPRETVTVEKDMSRERVARLAAELAGISGTNEAVAATGSPSSHAGGALRAAEGSAAGGAASVVGASGAERVREQPKDAAHAARMVAARRKAKRARRRAMADRQRELAEGGAPLDETQVISKSALRKIIEAAGNPNPQLTQTLTATSIGRGERFFSGSADAEERAAALAGPGEEAYAEREADARRAQDRREGRDRREALDPEATVALAAVGVEPVEPAEAAPEEPAEAQAAAGDGVAANTEASASDGGVAEQREPSNEPADTAAPAAAEDASNTDDAAAGAQVADAESEDEDDASAQGAEAPEETAPADDAPAEALAPADDDAHEAAQASSDGEEPASRAAAEDAPQGAPAEPASEDEQATTPIPARETSVKQPVQVPPPARTGRPVMTDAVQALAPALVPPPEPTPAEMAASLADEETPDEPVVHPGWYAVAEEARLDAETRPTPKVEPAARVSIMDFFPAVAPTGAEADMLRAVTGQIPAVGSVETDTEDEPAAGDAEEKPEAPAASGESDAEAEDSAEDAEEADDQADDDGQADAEDAVDAAADTAEVADSAEDAEEADDQADAEEAATPEEAGTPEEAADEDTDTAEAADSAEDAEEADDQADDDEADAEEAATPEETSDEEAADEQVETLQDAEATTVMMPVETAEAVTVDAEATQVLPTIEEQPALDETLVLPTADAAAKAADAASAAPDGADEEEPATASTKKAAAKKAPAKKTAAKKTQAAKKGGKKASPTAKKAVTEEGDKAENASESAAATDAKAPAKKAATKKANTKKGTAKKASAKKAATKKTSAAKSTTAK